MIDNQIQHPEYLPLYIEKIKPRHEGKYTCEARNHLGLGRKSIYITVLCKFICFFNALKKNHNTSNFLNVDTKI